MTGKTAQPRRPKGTAYRKLAISVPSFLAEEVAGQVYARRTPSVSAFISKAVEEKLERDLLQEALDEVWRARPMTRKERAWADRTLEA
jgi:Arc/MetJ-type ribon-helix-helix transcriptional regulator